jgi:GDP-L-fucose synthase
MDKILVSGAYGFVGKNLCNKLKTLGYTNLVELKGKTECDLTNQRFVDYLINRIQPDIVIHTAARVGGILANSQHPGTFLYENLAMGANLIESCRKYGKLKKFIMLGTVCSYPKYTEVPFKETDFWKGYPEETNAPYGIAKKAITEMLIAYEAEYGLNSTVLIPANMYGPHDHFNLTTSHVIPALILKIDKAIEQGSPFVEVWGSGNASREFLYVEDCVNAIILAMNKRTTAAPINIGTAQETTIKELIHVLAKKMNYHGSIAFQHDKLEGQPRRSLSINTAKKVLDYYPTISLEKGLDFTIDWYYKNKEQINDISYNI